MSRPHLEESEFDPDRVVIRDKRRLDPETGAVKAPAPPADEPAAAGDGVTADGAAAAAPGAPGTAGSPPDGSEGVEDREEGSGDSRVAELTADLQRVSAEYANYRKRVDRDRVAVVEMATAGLLAELLPVLDDVERARQHGDLTGAFAAVGERLEAVVGKAGLEKYGEAGEPFDPAVHEALMNAEPDPSASVAVCAQVLQPGYRLRGGRVLRPARVSVAEPGAPAGQDAPAAGSSAEPGEQRPEA
ncbi:MAG TPA: nucleotide exchange factor GrpE [Mycobacteriales bacterium]|nr:nucleotide exchange factor GrpE [Mycobacteriales bacterium]